MIDRARLRYEFPAGCIVNCFALGLIAVNEWWVSSGEPPPPSELPAAPPTDAWRTAIEPSPPLPGSPSGSVPLVFSGQRHDFLGLVARGAALEFITVGFYRFWLATDIRRHFWANTALDGDAAEYTGRGRELLIGFLFALAITVPIYLGYFLVGIEVERFKAFASVPLFLFFYLFGQFAIYRARRYRLTRTVWRGVRFWMDGSGWAYAAISALWTLLTILTLGLTLPWRAAALERYKMRHCHYGELQGGFDGRGWTFFKRGWWLWLLTGLLVFGPPTYNDVSRLTNGPLLPKSVISAMPFYYIVVVLAVPFIYAVYKSIEWRWWIEGLHFGQVRFTSSLARGALASLYWKVIGWVLLTCVVFAAYLLLCAWAVSIVNKSSVASLVSAGIFKWNIAMIVAAIAGYLMFILALNVVLRIYLMRDLWGRVAASTHVHNIAAAAEIAARGDLATALGEGFADSLDVVGF